MGSVHTEPYYPKVKRERSGNVQTAAGVVLVCFLFES